MVLGKTGGPAHGKKGGSKSRIQNSFHPQTDRQRRASKEKERRHEKREVLKKEKRKKKT